MPAERASGAPAAVRDSYQSPTTTPNGFKIIAATISKDLTKAGVEDSQKICIAACILELITTGSVKDDESIPELLKSKANEIYQKLADANYDRPSRIQFVTVFLEVIANEITLAQK